MAVPRQAPIVDSGRVNQKRRTRAALVAAAQELLDAGVTPTVPEAAERALVSRTTAYRYFPTQESLLVEVAVNTKLDDVEELVAAPVDVDGVEARLLELFELFNERVLGDESRYRTALRYYLDQWLATTRDGNDPPVLRAGRRTRWIDQILTPLEQERSAEELRLLRNALCLVCGIEAGVILRDVCQLDDDEALEVTRFAAEAILAKALHH